MAARNGLLTALGLAAGLVLMTLPQSLAAPPGAGSTYTFRDPVFNGTVVCDTLEQVWHIATAEQPDDVYGVYRITANEMDEPTCMAIVPTGVVRDVTPIGVMSKDGELYDAWAVETDIGGVVVYALYLERLVIGVSA